MRHPPQRLIDAIAAHLEAEAPREGCGVIVAPGRFIPIANVSPRPDAYSMDSKALLAVARSGARILAIVHSHIGAEAYFSSEDERMAVGAAGEPLWPGVHHLVIPVVSGRAGKPRCYFWDPSARHFAETEVDVIVDSL